MAMESPIATPAEAVCPFAITGSRQLIEQRLGLSEVGRVETFG
jgi:hypothetical protein